MRHQNRLNPELALTCRFIATASVFLAFVIVLNNFISFGVGYPSISETLGYLGFTGFSTSSNLTESDLVAGGLQFLLMLSAVVIAGIYSLKVSSLERLSQDFDQLSSIIIRVAFWAVLFVGITDAILSFLRVEGLHVEIFGKEIATKISQSSWRGAYIHIPIMGIAFLVGLRDKSVSVVWLVLLVVLAELLIVLAGFIFAYEQTFMGDLVRFWYAALFLFASAHTLKEEGHVRVDIFFAGMKRRTKAWVNVTGTLAFGIPLCWIILWRGLSGKSSLINSPMLNFETTMSGFGMYVKYLMAAFLVVFALSMIAQFTSYFFSALAQLDGLAQDGKES
jgi:TRAP-type mannitol/chloroaromatic compound transport system permease small subunit